ncbi:MAG: sigma-70 family RNA polymerase sigma factor [Nocardioidaceae bacterium]
MPILRRHAKTPDRLDASDLDRLFTEHGRALLSYVTRLTGDRQWAEDVTQETLLRAWTHPVAMSSAKGDPRPWLLTVARNLVRDQRRARSVRPQEVGGQFLEGDVETAVEDLDELLQSWVVGDCLASLSPDHRAVLVETFYRGRSVRQAAAVLGVPEGTVKSRTYYALRALRVALEERGVVS